MKSLSLSLLSVGIAATLAYVNNTDAIAFVWLIGFVTIILFDE